jgi:hypothetical protein
LVPEIDLFAVFCPLEASDPEDSAATSTSRSALDYLRQHLGTEAKWQAINKTVWHMITARIGHVIELAEIEAIAQSASCGSNEVLTVLALLSRPSAQFLQMEFLAADSDGEVIVEPDQVAQQVRAWWREKRLPDEQWHVWASGIRVQWRPVAAREGLE